METVKGVIIAVYKEGVENPRFLVMKRKKNWEGWELPKGHLEDDYSETVRQELREEAALTEEDILEVEELDHTLEWEIEEEDERREYRAFLVKVGQEAQAFTSENPHDEHEKAFFFRYRDAKPMLTYEGHRKVLEKAWNRIQQHD